MIVQRAAHLEGFGFLSHTEAQRHRERRAFGRRPSWTGEEVPEMRNMMCERSGLTRGRRASGGMMRTTVQVQRGKVRAWRGGAKRRGANASADEARRSRLPMMGLGEVRRRPGASDEASRLTRRGVGSCMFGVFSRQRRADDGDTRRFGQDFTPKAYSCTPSGCKDAQTARRASVREVAT